MNPAGELAWLSQPLTSYWLIIFAGNYAAMISAAGRVRPFNTQLLFATAVVILNLLQLTYGVGVGYLASRWSNPSWLVLLSFTLASFLTYAFGRLFAAFCRREGRLFHKDPANEKGKPLGDALDELEKYSTSQHIKGALVYAAFLVPLLCCLLFSRPLAPSKGETSLHASSAASECRCDAGVVEAR